MQALPTYRALIVDDEAIVRLATMRALSRVGFACEPAQNGDEALQMVKEASYDVVVTDLRMPQRNGHSLAVELLALAHRPAIVVLTGVAEPRLVKDLLARGVEDVCLKPIEYHAFATRVKGLADAREQARDQEDTTAAAVRLEASCEPTPTAATDATSISTRLSEVATRLPRAPIQFDAFRKASDDSLDVKGLTVAIHNDPTLAGEVLRLANTVQYASTKRIAELERSIAEVSSSAPRPIAGSALVLGIGTLLGWLLHWLSALVAS